MDNRALIPLLTTLTLISIDFFLSPVSAGERPGCVIRSVQIEAEEPTDHRDMCDGVKNALAFFRRLDLGLSQPLVIRVVPKLPDAFGKNLVGCYSPAKQTVYVLAFSAFERRKTWFEVRVNRAVYRSLATHEVAHAVAGCHFKVSTPTLHAHEYVAYVTMLATMNPALRAQILARRPGTGFEDESEINELTYAFDPMRFGIAAYRHYLKEGNGDAFLLQVLSGEALTNSIDELP
jgi:hypothetical protein